MANDSELIPLSKPDLTDRERAAVMAVLQTDRLTIGPQLEAFEQAVAQRTRRRFAVGVNSGTSGLHLCVRGLDLQSGDEVITTPFSFIATTGCLLYEGVRPVFVDIDPESYNLDPDRIAAAITPRTRAILPVEVFGNPVHFDRYEAIARRHGLHLIEDCCEALGASLHGRPAGSFGDCGVFAFYPNKQITTGEGGMVVTDDAELAGRLRSMRNQGRDTLGWLSHERLGYNYRLSELSAAMGVVQMERLDEILARRRQVARWYAEALADVEEIHLPPCHDPASASWFVYVVRLADALTATDRDAVAAQLQAAGIGCERYFAPIHHQPFIRRQFGFGPGDFPITERIAERTLALPFFSTMTLQQVQRVARQVRAALARPARRQPMGR